MSVVSSFSATLLEKGERRLTRYFPVGSHVADLIDFVLSESKDTRVVSFTWTTFTSRSLSSALSRSHLIVSTGTRVKEDVAEEEEPNVL